MKLATRRDGTRDGQLIVVRRDLGAYAAATTIAPTLQMALDQWDVVAPPLAELSERLNAGWVEGTPLDPAMLAAPLPRAYEWIDGSAYIHHIELVRKARNAEVPTTLRTDPLVYQGGSGVLLGPCDPIPLLNAEWGLDFESEVCVVLGDTPCSVAATAAAPYVRLLMLANDLTYRNLIPSELAKGFGFFCSKPATAFSPVAVTPDELGPAWHDGRVHLELRTTYNRTLFGRPQAGAEMHFSFYDLIAHVTRTRALTAGTILGSGTVSNRDTQRGSSCLVEARMLETLEHGAPRTPYMQPGDTVAIEMRGADGANIFGTIAQRVVAV
ncbi:MAG: fumarylacetoacetate hydrolase family protein [Deltaproteobacteria bacterium]|nr:fumarylacetoacetate hydrolase family protein [Deltaproteobacteria bacterium]